MPTRTEYSERLKPLLSEGFGLMAAAREEVFSIDDLAATLGAILEELERQHLGAGAHVQTLMAGQPSEPWTGDGELAFLLYFLHNPPPELREEIDALPELKLVWDSMAAVAASSPFTPASFNDLALSLPAEGMVKCNEWGDIYGKDKYEQLDPGWAWTLKNVLMNHISKRFGKGYGIADFVKRDWSRPVELEPGSDGLVRIAIIGDWGSGKYKLSCLAGDDGPACAVMDTLDKLPIPPEYIVHLGDTYYSGTGPNRSPKREENHNLVDILKLYPRLAKPGRCFTLNSNHEMYGGAYGYYGMALSNPFFSSQQGCSYFALVFGDWIVAGIDSAYFDPSNLYMKGGLGDKNKNPQYRFLQQVKASGKKVIVLSHHTGLSTDGGSPSEYLWKDVTGVLDPDYWYWGHIHLGAVYSAKAYSGAVKSRCIGHSSMPFAVPPGMEKCGKTVDWFSDTPLESEEKLQALYYSRPRAKNGFAVLTLSEKGITEEVYNIGSTKPVWHS
ncbi:MAG: metallophosphoesterase [Gammaproteobacteria bacterium]